MKNRDVAMCQLLVNAGAKLSATDNAGDNSLHLALRSRSPRLTQVLLVNPSDSKLLYRPNKLGETPYSIDQENPHPILPSIFGPIGADVDLKNMLGYDVYGDVLAGECGAKKLNEVGESISGLKFSKTLVKIAFLHVNSMKITFLHENTCFL